MHYFITAIDTDSGKTFCSGLLAEVLGYSYWKPIQAGEPTDASYITANHPGVKVIPEIYKLDIPASPHYSAAQEGKLIDLDEIVEAYSKLEEENLIIEGAGGLLVPLNTTETIADFIIRLKIPVVLISNYYLGSINHTLLTIRELLRSGISIRSVIFNGEPMPGTREVIESKLPEGCTILDLPHLETREIPEQVRQSVRQVFLS